MRRKPDAEPDPSTLRRRALDLLARREHGRRELAQKLQARGFDADQVHLVIGELEAEGLVSEARYAESYVRSRVARGIGPVRLRGELAARGVEEAEIERALSSAAVDWHELAGEVRTKRFGPARPADFRERARQARFLHQRGFGSEHIRCALDE